MTDKMLTFEVRDDLLIVTCQSDFGNIITTDAADRFAREVEAQLQDRSKAIIVDFAAVEMQSYNAALLRFVYKITVIMSERGNGDVAVLGASENVKDLISMGQGCGEIYLFDSLDNAVEHFSS